MKPGRQAVGIGRSADEGVRKQVERMLAESDVRLQITLAAANIGEWTWNLRTGAVHLSARWKAQVGYSQGQIPDVFREWAKRLHPEDRPRMLKVTRAYRKKPWRPYEEEYRLRHRDGSYRWFVTRADFRCDEDGVPVEALGAQIDITARKRAEHELRLLNETLEARVAGRTSELRESEDRLRAVVETAFEAIITISPDGTMRSFNPAAERMFGFRSTEAMGQSVGILMPSPYREEHGRHLRRYLKTGVPRIIGPTRELMGQRKDGSTFPIELSVSAVDHLGLFTGVVRDITERKRAEERDREHQERLSHALRVATAGELASGLAHELNQPLTAVSNDIQACLSGIRRGAGNRKLIGFLKHAAAEALRAGTIIHSIREFVESRPAQRERIDLRDTIRRASGLLIGELSRGDIDVRLEGMGRPVRVDAEAVQIEQVLINLVQNAVDSIRRGGGKTRLVVIGLSRSNKGGKAQVAVRDTGTGVSKAAAARLFDAFYSTRPDGLGVGLALCRTIIEAHGGRLWLEPVKRQRRGATFKFTLPLRGGKA